jgi:hypothetical protein
VISNNTLWRRYARLFQGRGAIVVAAAVLCCGCSSSVETAGIPTRRFIPSPEVAQAALEAVLDDWRAGRPRELIKRLEVQVCPIDNQRKTGQELDNFEILGEVPYEGVRCFVVRLSLTHPAAEQKVRYVILGIDPLYVYRQEDFELLNHWDHVMPAAEAGTQTATGAPQGENSPTSEGTGEPPAASEPDAPEIEQPAAADKPDQVPSLLQ